MNMKLCAHCNCNCCSCCCKSENSSCMDILVEDCETCKCKMTINSCMDKICISGVPIKAISSGVRATLAYACLICALMGFINEKSWELKNASSYVDCSLLLYSIIAEALFAQNC